MTAKKFVTHGEFEAARIRGQRDSLMAEVEGQREAMMSLRSKLLRLMEEWRTEQHGFRDGAMKHAADELLNALEGA